MKRRNFLRSAAGRIRTLDVSCETLYMQWIDAMIDDATEEFLDVLRTKFEGMHKIRLRQAFWLHREDLQVALKPLIADFQSRGGEVEYQ